MLGGSKWPARLLSVLHPFGFDDYLDENIEQCFGFCLPFLDFRVGIQGVDESFSFIITKEDLDYSFNNKSPVKLMKMLQLSQAKKETNWLGRSTSIQQASTIQQDTIRMQYSVDFGESPDFLEEDF